MLFAGWEVRIVKNCDRGLENAARGHRLRAAFSRPRSVFHYTDRAPRSLQHENRTEKEHSKRFSADQIRQLQRRFVLQNYISPLETEEIARSLGLSEWQVATWFKNRRAKCRRNLKEFKSEAAKIMDKEKFNRLCKGCKNLTKLGDDVVLKFP